MATKFSPSIFTAHLVQYAEQQATAAHMRAWLFECAPMMDDDQKIKADMAVVNALQAKYGLEASESSRPQYSGWTFYAAKTEDADVKKAVNAANVALFRARQVLSGRREQGAVSDFTAAVLKRISSKKESTVTSTRDACYEGLAALVQQGDAVAIQRVKHLMMLVGKR